MSAPYSWRVEFPVRTQNSVFLSPLGSLANTGLAAADTSTLHIAVPDTMGKEHLTNVAAGPLRFVSTSWVINNSNPSLLGFFPRVDRSLSIPRMSPSSLTPSDAPHAHNADGQSQPSDA
jgi:hypothetical protein